MWAHNGGRGAYLCDNCRTMICSGIRNDAPLDDAREVRRLSAVVGTPCGRLFCGSKCAAMGGLSANEYAPAFTVLRLSVGNDMFAVPAAAALGVAQLASDGGSWFWAAWEHWPRDVLNSLARLRDDMETRSLVEAAYRVGGYKAARPLLDEFFGRKT